MHDAKLEVEGVIPAMVTPFNEAGDVDEAVLREACRRVVDAGVHGILTSGGNGEFPLLSAQERYIVARTAVEEVGGAVPVLAGIGSCSTREALELAADAKKAGATALVLTAPYYFPVPSPQLIDHFRAVSEGSELPVIAYNNPSYTGNNLDNDALQALAESNSIIAVKQSNADLGQLVDLISRVGDAISILTGIDSQFMPSLAAGADGIFSTAAVVLPKELVSIYERCLAGDYASARKLQLSIQPLNRFMEYEPGYVAPCKELLRLQGVGNGRLRAPMPIISGQQLAQLHEAWRALHAARSEVAMAHA